MSINPQFILGKDGLPTNVVISFEEWQLLYEQVPGMVPEWQIKESLQRLAAYKADPSTATSMDDFLKELGIDDAEEI